MDSIFITGGAGFVGSYLAKAFKKEKPDRRVTVFDNLRRRGAEINLPEFKSLGIEFIHGDVRCASDLEDVHGEFDLFIEASAEPSVLAGTHGSPDYVIDTNLKGTINCLNWCRKRCGTFVFLSTSRVYSIEPLLSISLEETGSRFKIGTEQKHNGISTKGISEVFPTDLARSFYGTSKLASEMLIQEYVAAYNLQAIINRCGVIAGPGQFGKVDQGVFTLWVVHHLFGKSLKYTGFGGNGFQVRDLLHPQDLFELISLQKNQLKKSCGQIFNIGGGREVSTSLMEYTQVCQEITNKKLQIDSQPNTTNVDIPLYISDCSKAEKAFGWHPKKSVKNIVYDIHQWIVKNESTLKNIF